MDRGWVSLVREVEDYGVGPYPEESKGSLEEGGCQGDLMRTLIGAWLEEGRRKRSGEAEEKRGQNELVDVSVR